MGIKPEHYFYAHDGTTLKNKIDLLEFLRTIDENTFHEHVNITKNDFANWIKDILKDKRLAKKINKTKNVDEMILLLEQDLIKNKKEKHDKKSIISTLVQAITHGH